MACITPWMFFMQPRVIGKAEKISDHEMLLLKVAVLYHDSGFVRVYKNHEEEGCAMARKDLPEFGFDAQDEIETICGMVMATKIPQSPKTKLERIIADADLEYLGTDDFKRIGRTLFDEIQIYLNVESERQWNIIQMNFLKTHQYHTDFCKKNRDSKKLKNLQEIIQASRSLRLSSFTVLNRFNVLIAQTLTKGFDDAARHFNATFHNIVERFLVKF
jgi:uncharacterized protein